MKYTVKKVVKPSLVSLVVLAVVGFSVGSLAALEAISRQLVVVPVAKPTNSALRVEQPTGTPLGVEGVQGGEDNTAKTLQPANTRPQ